MSQDLNEDENYASRKTFQRLVEHLCDQALESDHTHKHAAGLLDSFSKGPVIMAHNEPRTCYDGNCARASGHAEFVACWRGRYLQARQRNRNQDFSTNGRLPVSILSGGRKRFSMIVIRIISDLERPGCYLLAESRPCSNCIIAMISFGIDKVYYSTRAGTIRCEKVHEMDQNHISRGFRMNETEISRASY